MLFIHIYMEIFGIMENKLEIRISKFETNFKIINQKGFLFIFLNLHIVSYFGFRTSNFPIWIFLIT